MCCCNSKALEMLNFESEDGILTENIYKLTNNLFAENTNG